MFEMPGNKGARSGMSVVAMTSLRYFEPMFAQDMGIFMKIKKKKE